MSVPLKEPLMPKVAPFFTPLAETLELLLKIDTFRSNQMKITMQRFRDLVRLLIAPSPFASFIFISPRRSFCSFLLFLRALI